MTALRFALPAGASEPRETELWTYDRDTGRVENAEGRPVLYVSSSRMDSLDVTGERGRATRTGHLAAAAPDMHAVLATIRRMTPEDGLDAEGLAGLQRLAETALAKADGRS